jgi:hypothetical protein
MLTRRLLLVTAGSVLAYGCAAPAPPSPPSPPTPPPPQNIIDDINAILSGLVTILPGLEFLPPDLLAKIEGLVGQAQQLVASLASAITSGNAGAVIQSFLDVVNQIVLALTGFGTMPAWLSTAIGASQFLWRSLVLVQQQNVVVQLLKVRRVLVRSCTLFEFRPLGHGHCHELVVSLIFFG